MRVVLDDAGELSAKQILSSAGWCETVRMCDTAADAGGVASSAAAASDPIAEPQSEVNPPSGQLSFLESVSTLDVEPAEIGHRETIVFFNDSQKFHWQRPEEPVDVRSGVVCSPNNFAYSDLASAPSEGSIRLTALANFDHWNSLADAEYAAAKQHWYDRLVASAVRFIADFRSHVVAVDVFTPKTIRRFTGHDNGAVYGDPKKRFDGTTATEKRLSLRDRPGSGRYHRGHDQRHPDGQPVAERPRPRSGAELRTPALGIIVLMVSVLWQRLNRCDRLHLGKPDHR